MSVRVVALLASMSFLCAPAPGLAQVVKPPVQAKPQAKPPVKPPAKPPVAAPAAKKGATPTPVAKPTPAPPSGLHFKSSYTAGDQVTESTTYIQTNRERYEFADTILLKRPDQKRTIQISRAANTYLVTSEGLPIAPASAGSTETAPKAPGVVMLTTTIVDTGERKELFGRQARHVTTAIERQPEPSACDQSKLRIETDGWYIDLPAAVAMPPAKDEPPLPHARPNEGNRTPKRPGSRRFTHKASRVVRAKGEIGAGRRAWHPRRARCTQEYELTSNLQRVARNELEALAFRAIAQKFAAAQVLDLDRLVRPRPYAELDTRDTLRIERRRGNNATRTVLSKLDSGVRIGLVDSASSEDSKRVCAPRRNNSDFPNAPRLVRRP